MKRVCGVVTLLIAPGASTLVVGQTAPAAPTGQKTLAATMNVYVFPTKGQKPEHQSQDEAECYNFATQNTGTDPFALQKQSQQQAQQTEQAKQQAQQTGKGAGASGAVKGAAAGALIGEIASDDAGKGAAYGAAAGGIPEKLEESETWRTRLTAEQIATIGRVAGELLRVLGYL